MTNRLEPDPETRLDEQLSIVRDAGYTVRFAVTQEPGGSIVSCHITGDDDERIVCGNAKGPDDATTRIAALSKAIDVILIHQPLTE